MSHAIGFGARKMAKLRQARKPETTSKRVAKIAGKILALRRSDASTHTFVDDALRFHKFKWSDIRALAASCLTQAADHADRETLKAGKLPKGHRRTKVHKPVKRRLLHD